MSNLPQFAAAQLVMLNGSLCSVAELAIYLEQYGYQEDPPDSNRWVFVGEDPQHAQCSLEVGNEGELFTIYGEAAEHFTNLNYLMQKAGWVECSVLSRSQDVEAKLLARLVSVDVKTASTDMPASSLRVSANEPAPAEPMVAERAPVEQPGSERPADAVSSEPLGDLHESHHRIEQLTIRCNTAEERYSELESSNSSLVEENEALRRRLKLIESAHPNGSATLTTGASPAERGSDGSVEAVGLVEAIEKHLSALIDLPASSGTPFLADLRNLGYEPRLRLVRVG